MNRSSAAQLAYATLLALGVWSCSSASAAAGEPRSTSQRATATTSAKPTLPSASARATPPRLPQATSSNDVLGSTALEHRLDQLEKDIQSSPE